VYLTNVEGICRRFVDEKRESLLRMKETTASFKAYWASQTANDKKALVQHKGSDMLKVRPAVTMTHCFSVNGLGMSCTMLVVQLWLTSKACQRLTCGCR